MKTRRLCLLGVGIGWAISASAGALFAQTCGPNSTLTACEPVTCAGGLTEECLARCGKLNPFTGLVTVNSCDCRPLDECHLIIPTIPGAAVAGVGGNPCVVPDNGGGTVTLPPVGCEYLSPDEVHAIINGLPAGTTIKLAPIHKDFICHKPGSQNPVCTFSTLVDCEEAGGSLGGEKECAESKLQFDLSVVDPGCTTSLCGWTRPVLVPMAFETHTAPRSPGDPVQSFDTDMFRMFGQINNIGDPDFDLLRIVAGTDFGMPSPGHTTLTKLPGGGWAVDSFFDIEYRIDFIGAPGGRLDGRSGSTTGTIRMQTGAPFRCEGGCPVGFVCEDKRIVNADGTINLCCDCIPQAPSPCPLPTVDPWCIDRQATDCVADHSTDVICLVRGARFPTPTAGPIIEKCDCFDDVPACGPVDIRPNPLAQGFLVSCPGPCPPGENCELHFNGLPTGVNSIGSGQIPPFALVTCDCAKRPPPDPHRSQQGTSVTFGTDDVPAIPADFFYPGSLPFTGVAVNMQPGPMDTLIQRSGFMVCPPPLPPPTTPCDPIQTEIVALDLVSVAPITVGTTQWNVAVGLSVMPQTLGTLNATKTHANGGTFNAEIRVLPRITFTEVGNPGNVKTIDYGLAGLPHIRVNFINVPWVINLDPLLVGTIAAPSNGNFVPGVLQQGNTQVPVPANGISKGGGVGHPVGPVRLCPLPQQGAADPCAPFQARDCPQTGSGEVCVPTIMAAAISGTPPQVLACGCRGTNECRIGFGTAGPTCINVCPDPTLVCTLLGTDTDGDGVKDQFSCDCAPPPPPDPHRSVQGTSVTFGTADVPTIPAGFFFGGSPMVTGVAVNMQPGPMDTLIQRSGPIVCPGAGHPRPCNVVQTEIVALDLRSVAPLPVGATQWNVAVGLSANPQSQGTLSATKTHANGGTFDAEIRVLPRITFTEVGNPGNVKTIDYGVDGIPTIRVNFTVAAWVEDLSPPLVGTIAAPNDGNFVPGVLEQVPGNPNSQVVVQATGNSKGGGVSHPVDPVPLCPLPQGAADPCAPFQARDCQQTALGDVCVPTVIQRIPGTPPHVLACGCRGTNECHVGIGATGPTCVNVCPDLTMACTLTGVDTDGDGVEDRFSCDCVQRPVCPVPTVNPWCQSRQTTDCVVTDPSVDHICLIKRAHFVQGAPPSIDLCDCFPDAPNCGPVSIVPNQLTPGFTVSCPPGCPPGQICELHYNGNPQGMTSVDSSLIPATAAVTCACVTPVQTGACCTFNAAGNVCINNTTLAQCQGNFIPGVTCSGVNVSCCLPNGSCSVMDQVCCQAASGTPVASCAGADLNGNGVDDACEPQCGPNAAQTGCTPIQCPAGPIQEECQKHCVTVGTDGIFRVTDCDCRGVNDCHMVTANGGNVAGGPNGCVVPDNGGGTVTLPPVGCDYLSPDEVHMILDGLPVTVPPTTIELAPIHKDFICHRQDGTPGTCSFPPPIPGVDCDKPGGSLGGEEECADSMLHFDAQCVGGCPGGLAGFNRPIDIPVSFETHIGPRIPGAPVQSFDTDMFRMQGQMGGIGDPDFDLLRITAGSGFNMPSPGHTTLTKLPGGNWAVDSFFDIEYRIDFVGKGPRLGGMSGSTTGTIRMQTSAPFKCVGGCNTGRVCVPRSKANLDGSKTICCDCRKKAIPDITNGSKGRFISFAATPSATAAAGDEALRVNLGLLHHVDPPYTAGASIPITVFEGEVAWAGPPAVYLESNSSGVRFVASQLQCDPYYRDWTAFNSCSTAAQICTVDGDCPMGGTCSVPVNPLLHVTGVEIVPSSVYSVESVPSSCQGSESTCADVSDPLVIVTTRWGDIVGPFNPPSTTTQPDTSDIAGLVNKFKSVVGAPIKARAMLAGIDTRGTIDLVPDVNFTHIAACVDAFKGLKYPYYPGKCTGGLRACGADSDCVGSNCVGGTSDGAACNPGACAFPGVCTLNTAPCIRCP